ncbi:MAG TPA: hypothetical protein VMD97_03300 [Candidatus Aquilonibacter sp.]|nr:hypothetical protein [Candidatus Aquilonibacter sp.]
MGSEDPRWFKNKGGQVRISRPDHRFCVEPGKDSKSDIDLSELDGLSFYASTADSLDMACLPTTMSQFLADKFKVNPNVRAVLVGESNEVHHVWVLLHEWNPSARKAVYAIQKDILQKVRGFNFDFYVVDVAPGANPSEMVSGIPVVYLKD